MKKSIALILLSLVLLFAAYDRVYIRNDADIYQIENDSLKQELLKAKKFHRYGIFVGDTTIHYTTNLKIQGTDYKYLHIERLKNGHNEKYFELTENVGVTLIIEKY